MHTFCHYVTLSSLDFALISPDFNKILSISYISKEYLYHLGYDLGRKEIGIYLLSVRSPWLKEFIRTQRFPHNSHNLYAQYCARM